MLFGGLFAQSVRAVISNPAPVCVGSNCTITFSATGDYYLWTPPTGAKNITFDLMGAQGGRSGGLGGRVTGTLNSTPAALYIYVGGAGSSGSNAVGGFNGGGNAGGIKGDEGSGGGATDIRTGTTLADRLAVAGGGGGSGGFNGSVGGNAGGLTGSNGTTGQGGGGGAGTQTSGGNGGAPNGGTWGYAGALGVGGAGGSAGNAGGGGGGGGYYGGGGGGADTDATGLNGGGGGGGSSWSSATLTTSVVHTAGYRAGIGMAVLTYVMPPTVSSFTTGTTLTNATSLSYNLVFSESVTGLTNTDFVTTGSTASCTIGVSGTGSSYLITASTCSAGTFRLALSANSVTGVIAGPLADATAPDVVIDRALPSATISAPTSPTNATTLTYTVTFSESVTGLTTSDFSVTGTSCIIGALSGTGQNYTITVTGCADGAGVQLSLAENSVSDAATNAGPSPAPVIASVAVDRSVAEPFWATAAATTYLSPSFEVSFAEAITDFTAADVSNAGTATGCVISVTSTTVTRYAIATSGCSLGSVQISINPNSYTDALGNTGPAVVRTSGVTSVIAQPAPAPTPTPTPTPSPSATPTPTPSPTPTAAPAAEPATQQDSSTPLPAPSSSNGSDGDPGTPVTTEAFTEIIPAQPLRKTYELSPLLSQSWQAEQEPEYFYDSNEPQITVDNPTNNPPTFVERNWQSWLGIGVGIISSTLAGIGVIKAARQMRTRRLLRKFA